MKKIYLDCNILLDWLLDRKPYGLFATQVIVLIQTRRVDGYVSALSLANVYYLLKRNVDKKLASEFLRDSRTLFSFVDLGAIAIERAIAEGFKDFEDDLQYFACIQNKIDCLITRNKKDFRPDTALQIVSAEEFVRGIE